VKTHEDLPLARHQLVYLQAAAWQRVLAEIDAPIALRDELQDWPKHDWPLVLARQTMQTQEFLTLGWSLPPRENGDKPRLTLQVAMHEIAGRRLPLSLQEVIALLQQQNLKLPVRLQELAQLHVQIFGSWSWQALTGLAYLRPSSDIDVLLPVQNQAQLVTGLRHLQAARQTLPLDGEIVFPDDSAVAWREWLQQSEQVLVKSFDAVSLARREELLALLPAG
jgi:phosphoribosyl-dephospho-CoA transferase